MKRPLQIFICATLLSGWSFPAAAQESLCDTKYEDCRTPLINLIRNETQGIDVAFWFMEDARYVTELINRHNANVPVRILVDQRANASKRLNEEMLNLLRDGGIPMRDRYVGDILHFKMMLFEGQNTVQFSKANYTPSSFVPEQPNVNYFDEAIFFTNDLTLTNSFRRRFDDLWVNTTSYRNFGNVTENPLVRRYPGTTIHSSMNFPPLEDFSNRSVSRYNLEMQGIDAVVFRVTDARHADAMIRAVARQAPVRLITEPTEYRNPLRLWHAKHVDRMWAGGVQIKHRQHGGLLHQASVVMHGLGEVIFGSSNWTTASASWQDEHNYFYRPTPGNEKLWFFQWFADQFQEKWTDTVNYVPFQPLPPDVPINYSPINGASGQSTSVTLNWDGGTWAHLYDIYLDTNPNPQVALVTNRELGSPVAGQRETFGVTNLQPGTTYYWRIVGRTWALQSRTGPVWSFTTAGAPPGGGGTPYGGTPAAVPGVFQAENFDEGAQFVAYYDTTAGNRGGAYRTTDVDIATATDTGGGHYVGWTKAGEWLKYTVNVGTTGTYSLQARLAALGTGGRFHVEIDGVDRTGPIPVPNTGAWDAWQTITTAGIPLTAGLRTVRVVFDVIGTGGAVAGFNWFQLGAGSAPPPPPPPYGGTPYGGTPAAIPGVVQAENFDDGAAGVAYFDASTTNSGGAYRSTGVDIAPSTDTGGGYYVGWTKAGEWVKYTVTVATTGTYTLQTRFAALGTGGRFHVEVDGVDRTGPIAVPNTGAWDAWQTLATPNVSLSAGQHVVRVVFDVVGTGGAVAGFNWFQFVGP